MASNRSSIAARLTVLRTPPRVRDGRRFSSSTRGSDASTIPPTKGRSPSRAPGARTRWICTPGNSRPFVYGAESHTCPSGVGRFSNPVRKLTTHPGGATKAKTSQRWRRIRSSGSASRFRVYTRGASLRRIPATTPRRTCDAIAAVDPNTSGWSRTHLSINEGLPDGCGIIDRVVGGLWQ
jgi:hypothetical protein